MQNLISGTVLSSSKANIISSIDTVVIAKDGDKPVGCGCFKKNIEIKRMYVCAEYWSRGISKGLLKELENWAKRDGFFLAVLETGEKQT